MKKQRKPLAATNDPATVRNRKYFLLWAKTGNKSYLDKLYK
ncbi:hypothetical protein [Paenibacillus hamazuiensis]|nr:hypothetical protein [Paenibacillus hamazuiensis]